MQWNFNLLYIIHMNDNKVCLSFIDSYLSFAPLQSSKVSKSPIKRLTRRDRGRRGQPSASDHNQKDKLRMSVPDATVPTSACSSTSHSKITGTDTMLRRRTLLYEDDLNLAPPCHRYSVCSLPDLNTDAPVLGPRSVLLHQTLDQAPPSPPFPRGLYHDFF